MLVARIPVLYRGVFHFGIIHYYNLHNGGMELIFITHWCRAPFKITHISIVFGDDECTLKLSRITSIDAEIRAEFHRASHAFRDIHKRAVTENSTVQCRKEIVTIRHYATYVLLHQVGMLFDRFTHRAKDDAFLAQLFFEGCFHRHRIHNGIYCCATKYQAFFQRDSQLIKGLFQFWINLFVLRFLRHWVSIIRDSLIVYLW